MSALIKSLSARLAVMVIAFFCGMTTTHLVTTETGIQSYALFSLLIALPALAPLPDFGVGVALVNVMASEESTERVEATALTVARVLVGVAISVILIDVILLLSPGWRWILGQTSTSSSAEIAAFACVFLFALGIPLALAQRMLLGLGLNHVIIACQALQAPMTLFVVWFQLHGPVEIDSSYLALSAFIALLCVAGVITLAARHRLRGLLKSSFVRLLFFRRYPGAQVRDVGVPMLIQSLLIPLATQLDRIIIGQVGSVEALAEYGVAAQMFVAIQSLFTAIGMSLWPHFLKQSSGGERVRPISYSALFVTAAIFIAAFMALIAPSLARFVTSGVVELHLSTVVGFSAALVAQAAIIPLGMSMMDSAGVRFQVLPAVAMILVNLTLTVMLTPKLGAAGPTVATGVSIAVCQFVPYILRVARLHAKIAPSI